MIRIAALLSILLTTSANSECWIVTNLHGYGAMNGDKSSVYESVSGVYPEMKYTALSSNTMVGEYQSGGGITVETWSITTNKKALYSKVMNIPGMQQLTSTKSFVGDVVGTCNQ
ncbi:TPA: hypothetical protein IG162_003048 [Escherichia coli]|nr:hypothetical protein [Escherichia coli]